MRCSAPVVSLAFVIAACGLGVAGTAEPVRVDVDGGTTPPPSPIPEEDVLVPVDASADADAAPPVAAEVFVSSTTALWKLDPMQRAFSKVADWIDCGAGIEELAIDRGGVVFATRIDNGALFEATIGPSSAACTLVQEIPVPYTLSFAPVPGSSAERLVAYANGTANFVSVDPVTAESTIVTAGALGTYRPGGDLVVGGGKGYLSAVAPNGDCPTDCLLEVDPETGALVKKLGELPEQAIYGLAYWGGLLFAFGNSGNSFVVTPEPFAIEDTLPPPDPSVRWRGAGSRTDAPSM
jgi:hypothetical protein